MIIQKKIPFSSVLSTDLEPRPLMILDGNEGHHFTSRHVIFFMLLGTNMSKRPIIFIVRAEKVALTPTEIVSVVINKWVLVMRSKRAKCELVTLRCQLHRARPDEEDPWCRGHELTKHVKKLVLL